MNGIESIYNQDYFGIDTDTEIGLVFTTTVNTSDVILDIENWVKGSPKNSIFLKKFNKYMIKEILNEKEVLLRAGQRLSKNNLIGFFDPEGWGFRKITSKN